MRISDKILTIKALACFQIILGSILLIHEIRDFISLPTMEEMERLWGECVDLIKYKDTTYVTIPLYTFLVLSGASYWFNPKVYRVISIAWLASFLLYFLEIWQLIYYQLVYYNIFITTFTTPPF